MNEIDKKSLEKAKELFSSNKINEIEVGTVNYNIKKDIITINCCNILEVFTFVTN